MSPKPQDQEIAVTIRQQVERAYEKHLVCQIYSIGMYKGINGYVKSIHHGVVVMMGETEEGVKVEHTFRLSDIKRISVFDED